MSHVAEDPIYPQFGRRPWSDGIYTILLHLHATAVAVKSSDPEDLTHYAVFEKLMGNLSLLRYGRPLPFMPVDEEVESLAGVHRREAAEAERYQYLVGTLRGVGDWKVDQPHPFDLERCHLALIRPWPSSESTLESDFHWRMEVLGWYEDWPVMSVSPKVDAAVGKATTVLLRALLGAEGADPGRRERIRLLWRVGRASWKDYRERRKALKDARGNEVS